MKHTLLLLTVTIISFVSCVVSKDTAAFKYPNPFEFQKIDTIKGTKDELFVKANEWVAKTFNSAKDVIQMHDKEAGKIIAKGEIETTTNGLYTKKCEVGYTLSIDAKDGKCRIVLSDFIATEYVSYSPDKSNSTRSSINLSLNNESGQGIVANGAYQNTRANCYTMATGLLNSFDKYMQNTKTDNF